MLHASDLARAQFRCAYRAARHPQRGDHKSAVDLIGASPAVRSAVETVATSRVLWDLLDTDPHYRDCAIRVTFNPSRLRAI